jgi:hypothetical protein
MSRLTLREAFEYLCQQHQYNYDCLGGQPYDDGWKLKVSTGSSIFSSTYEVCVFDDGRILQD